MDAEIAGTGAQAIEWVMAGRHFDAVLVKARLPHLSGAAVCEQLRRAAGGPLPCLLMAPLGWRANARSASAEPTISKPFKAGALRDALCALLGPAVPQRLSPLVAAAHAGSATRTPLRLMLVEDNAVNQRVAVLVLQGLGYDAEVVANGAEALDAIELARERRVPFDAVIMDLQMPVLDGLETTRRLCTQYPDPADRPWVLALTAYAMPGDRERCLAAGMDDYLSKPIRAAALGRALSNAAAGRQERLLAAAQARSDHPLEALDPEARSRLVDLFVTEARRLQQAMHAACTQRDAPAAAGAARALAGAAGYFETGPLPAVCGRLQAAAGAGDLEGFAQHLVELDRVLAPALDAILGTSRGR
jgi:CheY-like chemotaxis protein